jgi:hypothetical protein
LPEIQVLEQKEPRMKSYSILAILLACAATASALGQAQDAGPQSTGPTSGAAHLVYRNAQYDFCFVLPASWKGYTIVEDTWVGTPLNGPQQTPIKGPELLIRNPRWTEANPYQDIPIMIFTRAHWKLAETDDYAFSAAPFGPREIGRNRNFVFAQPPRWIGYTDLAGMREVEDLMMTHPFQAPCPNGETPPAKSGSQ